MPPSIAGPAHRQDHAEAGVARHRLVVGVRPAEPLTIDQYEHAYARPLLAFCTFAANRRDAIIYDPVSDKARKQPAVNLRAGRTVDPHAWRPDNRFLFRAEQIDYVHVCSGGG